MKLRPEVATAVEIRLVAAEVLIRMARRSLHPHDLLKLLDGARREIADAVQVIDAGKGEEPIAQGPAWHPGAENDTSRKGAAS